MPVFNPALLQELVTQVTGIVQSSPLNAARLVPLALPVQQLYESALAEYLLQTVTTFVELHPPAPGDHARLNSNAQTSLVMVLHDLLSLQSITPALQLGYSTSSLVAIAATNSVGRTPMSMGPHSMLHPIKFCSILQDTKFP